MMNKVVFSDMKLAGIVFICAGFLMVLTPANWDVIIKQIIRSYHKISNRHILFLTLRWRRPSASAISAVVSKTDVRTGYIESRLRSPSGRVR